MTVSIVLPTFNGGRTLADVLERVRVQQVSFDVELVAIDSGSTDGTLDVLRAYSATVLHVPRERFNHGATRNAALAHASGEFAVLLTQDAVPADATWLSALVHPLLADQRVAGSFGRQLPSPGASRLATYALKRWVAAQPESRVSGPMDRQAFDAMKPGERHLACAFDNVCACVRMAVWRQQPFPEARIAEDLQWARDVLLRGYKIAYAPDACVRHSHDRGVLYELRRTYLVHQQLQSLFGLASIPTLASLLRAIVTTVPLHLRVAAGEPRHRWRAAVRAAALGVAWPLGQYLGARSRRTGREYLSAEGI